MQDLWLAYGFYLWLFTTVLVLIALAWLAWNTFMEADPPEPDQERWTLFSERLDELAEAMPFVQASTGRTLQYYGLATRDTTQALALSNARGEGVVWVKHEDGHVSMLALSNWQATGAASEARDLIQTAIERAQQERTRAQNA